MSASYKGHAQCRCLSSRRVVHQTEHRRKVHADMQFTILLSNSVFATFFLLLYVTSETTPCDTKWIRLVYMLSCGKKKRESIPTRNESFSEPLPTDLYGALHYFRERDPTNPLFNEDVNTLNEILNEDEREFERVKSKYGKVFAKLMSARHPKKIAEPGKESVFMTKLVNSRVKKNHFGIQGFPDQWDIHELVEQKTNENYRREIDRLLDKCCKTAHESSCNGDTFRGACK